jgi:hypothetical protein
LRSEAIHRAKICWGVPDDATICGVEWDAAGERIRLVWRSASGAPVAEGSRLTVLNVTAESLR